MSPPHNAMRKGKTKMNEQKTQTPAPYAAGTGSVPTAPDRAAFDRMGYRERLALKRENPEVYREMRK